MQVGGAMQRRIRARFGIISAVAISAALLMFSAAPVLATTATPTCRASLVRIQGKGIFSGVFFEPIVTGGQPCTASSNGLVNPLTLPFGLGSVRILTGTTSVAGTGNHPTSTAEVVGLVITAPGLPTITASVLRSTASAGACQGNPPAPALSGSSELVGLTIGGTAVDVGTTPITIPLGPAGTLYLNRTLTSGGTVTQRALELNTPLANVVVAEAQAGFIGNPCA